MRLPTFRRTAAVAATGLLLLLAACGGKAESPAAPAGQAASGAFPVSLAHKYGTTEIKSEPKRIVVVGLVEQDALLSVGVVPVATTEWFGQKPGAIWPWAQAALGGAAKPQVLTNTDGLQFEKVAALRPDLILGVYSALTAEDYATLSKIAPTVAQPQDTVDYGVSWQDLTRTVGTAVGRKAQADKVVADVEAKFAAVRTANPRFAGATGLMATTFEGYYVYGPQDSRGRLLTDLGFKLPDGLAAVTGKEFGANLSREHTDMLDTDALIWLVDDYAKDKAKVQADPLYAKLDVKTQGRDVFLENNELVGAATSFVTPLSLPYLLDKLVPQLAAAVDGNPATAVQRAAA
ncbi:iron-siderophore ABC transporter substrate-binding protein [Krasilnikovia sp. MM14-A1259]|uniref:iron-siderophore ABC transporter substrate-binding protein n=1 Tax=Krasilnikovia sp. MM14-A1259 TaxID=3373539 RepID=UPI003800D412